MLSQLDRHDLTISRCGVPLSAELLNVCLSNPQPPRLEQALIWLALLHGLDELGPMLATAPAPLVLGPDQAVGLYVALHVAGNPAQAAPVLHRLLVGSGAEATEAATASTWQVMNRVLKRAENSPWAELMREVSLLHLSDPAALFAEWLRQLERCIAERMPFTALLRLSILCRRPEKLPRDWQARLAEAILAIGDRADGIPLYRFWMVTFQLAPDWDYACIRAADLALRFEDFPIAEQLVSRIEPINIGNPWFYDVQARCRYAYGDLKSAARMWSVALLKMDASAHERQVLHDRLRVALRGKLGLGEVSRLSRCGQNEAALELLRFIILHDPVFASNYTLLASLMDDKRVDKQSSTSSTVDLQSVEEVIERFGFLAPTDEGLAESLSADHHDQLMTALREAAAFLDGCEESVFQT